MIEKEPTNPVKKPIYVTQPFLPPLEEFIPYLEQIWESKILTNGGPLHQQLEAELCRYLEVPYISLFNNGTIALIVALQALELAGEVITTPFTFIATTNAILWNNLTPVFVDIDPQTLNLDPQKIEAAITPKTSAILPVHCYGNACDVEAIEEIAIKHKLKVVYDAAHAFGVRCHCGSILNHGDLSVLSFHATKVFNTFEGGAIVCQTEEMKQRIDRLKNFGFASETEVIPVPGLNGKLSEIQAAMGLAQLKHIDENIARRRKLDWEYRQSLIEIPGIRCLAGGKQLTSNFSYFPILVQRDYPASAIELQNELKRNGIFSRRYFFPTADIFLSKLNSKIGRENSTTFARQISSEILCLPMYSSLRLSELKHISNLIRELGHGTPNKTAD